MKIGPVTKLDKRNVATSKRFDDNATSANSDVIVFFPIYGPFAAIWEPYSGRMAYEIYIFINNDLLCYKN